MQTSRSQNYESSISEILSGAQHIVSFPGQSQYAAGSGGTSACGLAAFNCARIVFRHEAAGRRGKELLAALLDWDMMEVCRIIGSLRACADSGERTGSSRHLLPMVWICASRG
jgi:hypothetical protein